MMSDEEKAGDVYIRHPPSYRSELVYNFIAKLESRCDKTPNSQPRTTRVIGSPVNKPVPHNTKDWLLKPEFRSAGELEESVTYSSDEVV